MYHEYLMLTTASQGSRPQSQTGRMSLATDEVLLWKLNPYTHLNFAICRIHYNTKTKTDN